MWTCRLWKCNWGIERTDAEKESITTANNSKTQVTGDGVYQIPGSSRYRVLMAYSA